ncbi:MAG: DUF2799 domain-containing protein [Pseudobdellovibrionaceae bacterium]
MKLSIFSALTAIAFLSACSTFSKKECETMNWGQKGYESALKGEASAREALTYYDDKCKDEHGVEPQRDSFSIGYNDGLKVFCTPEYAKRFGSEGGVYKGHCPKDPQTNLEQHYSSGRLQFLEIRVKKLEQEVHDLQSSLSSARSDVSECEARCAQCTH